MRITYYANDGYLTGDRPLHTKISDQEILDAESVDEAMEMIDSEVQSDFENKVTPGYDTDKIRAEVEKLFAQKKDQA